MTTTLGRSIAMMVCMAGICTLDALAGAWPIDSDQGRADPSVETVSILSLTHPRRGARPRLISDENGVFLSNDPTRTDAWVVTHSNGEMTIAAKDGVNKGKYLSIDKDGRIVMTPESGPGSRWVPIHNTTGGRYIRSAQEVQGARSRSLGVERPEMLRSRKVFTDRVTLGSGVKWEFD